MTSDLINHLTIMPELIVLTSGFIQVPWSSAEGQFAGSQIAGGQLVNHYLRAR